MHAQRFGDGLMPLPTDPGEHDSDVTITKLDRNGTRLWSRVIGTRYEDEPYAIAAGADEVVVAGRSRRNPGRTTASGTHGSPRSTVAAQSSPAAACHSSPAAGG